MSNQQSFVDFVLDQLASLNVTARRMFGEVGLYSGDQFFGIVAENELYLRIDDANRERFERAGTRPFHPFPDKPPSVKYFSVAPSVLEDRDELVAWARRAVKAAREEPPAARSKSKGR